MDFLFVQVLPREQCEGIKNFVVQQVIDISSDPAKMQQQSTYLNKLNLVLIQIVKHVSTFVLCCYERN